MYTEYYGLIRRPFEMTPDPSFLYLGEAHREGLAMLQYAVESRKGFVLLTGEVGTGKTTLLHSLLSQLDSRTNSAFVFNPRLKPIDFFKVIFDEFEITKECRTKGEYLMALNHYLIDKLEQDEPVLLIVDEAQNLSAEMLEEIRLLSNLETPTSKLLQIMLVGQPELKVMLAQPELRQLRQRIVLRHHLRPFNPQECASYVDERLRLAGYTDKALFDRGALREIHDVSEGIPRLVNVVCDGALLLGFSREMAQIDGKAVREVAGDLELGSERRLAEGNGTVEPRARRRRGLFGLFR
jgi:general secretion pathway protein A